MEISSIDLWYALNIYNQSMEKKSAEIRERMFKSLKQEIPGTLEVTFERNCNLNCKHCAFQVEVSSRRISEERMLDRVILNIVRQLPSKKKNVFSGRPTLIHGGRILREWHLDVLRRVREARPDIEISLIDNGSYSRLLDRRSFMVDRLDISVDGLEKSHNLQRDPLGIFKGSKSPWGIAMTGLESSHKIVSGGLVSVLMTVTKINYRDLAGLADFIFRRNLADEIHYTLMTPARAAHNRIAISVEEFAEMWKHLIHVFREHKGKVFFRMFTVDDVLKLESVVGPQRLWRALVNLDKGRGVKTGEGTILFAIDGVTSGYFPVSLWPHEAFLIDADAVSRLAHMQQFTIAELRTIRGKAKKYNVAQLRGDENYSEAYRKTVDVWLDVFGYNYLSEESSYFKRLKKRGGGVR